MRPLRLDLAGFTVFRDETTVDFTDADFFALVGPTGSGKSTVLDAVCFALYGTVPRWGDRRAVGNALAPSATEARVRLCFESAGSRYVASRVVRRDGKGRVTTAHAGLELLPPGFDLRRLDEGLSPQDLGEVLAGTPGEMDAAVLAAVGLPYEQFTRCVVLPQGAFAEFLHARPAARQEMLVSLLGLEVYEQIRVQAAGRAAESEARLGAVDQVLAGTTAVDDATLAAAQGRVADTAALLATVDATLPRLAAAQRGVTDARAALAAVDREVALLAAVRAPADAVALTGALAAADAAAADADAAVAAAEADEEAARAALAAHGDEAALRRLLDTHAEEDAATHQRDATEVELAAAEAAQAAADRALAAARAAAAGAAAALEDAREGYQRAQSADRATALRRGLAAGDDCPVCAQPVAVVPDLPAGSAVAAAEAAGKRARTAADEADADAAAADRAARSAGERTARLRAARDQRREDLDRIAERLARSPGPAQLRAALERLAAGQRHLAEAGTRVRQARADLRRARAAADAAQGRVGGAWQAFDAARDAVAACGPPPADRGDLAAAWAGLAGWARAAGAAREADRPAAQAAVSAADDDARAVVDALAAAFVAAEVDLDDDPARAAAVAAERARAELDRLGATRAQTAALHAQRAAHADAAQVAKSLANHLRANNFERWLLAEALDVLVDGASAILRELTGGQYALAHDKGEFHVVDQYDAGLRRAVRTLSGGETFQASLALALALSAQLAGLSTTAASLESIILDEGFGTLDAATLDTVAATLEALAARGDRMVGVVTHVAGLAARVPVRFEVHKDARSARVTRTGLAG
ncbi:hypothetical protein GCM10010124_35200 [Pilimelia terevasa]|uniref:Nuclease SbcCD subunit C n=1 Tax=Pilimelia terevasa TaxID=53372 RepID=A0A8J3BTE8_9ACTN|nr:SMC family ATPase [Pilimelia terevasa]GGK39459.1 hypothetical protein GCM10010124_35200 [Pilimelia terevasa]